MASEVPEPEAGSGKEDEDLELDLSAGLLVLEDGSANSNYQVFSFRSDLGPGDHHDVPIILITRIDTKILVAIPYSFWHRLTRQRLLPSAAFSKAVSVAVAAVEDSHREVAVDNVFIKVWIGLLTPRFEVCIEAASEETALGFHTEDQEEGFCSNGPSNCWQWQTRSSLSSLQKVHQRSRRRRSSKTGWLLSRLV